MGPSFERLVRRLPEFARVVLRFPVATAALLALTLYFVFDLHLLARWSAEARFIRIPSALAAIVLWATAATLYAEARGQPHAVAHSVAAIGSGAIALLFWLANALELTPWAVLAALALAVGLAPYAARALPNAAFWQFNHTLAVAWLLALLGIVLFAGGLSLVLETLRVLLGVETPYRAHEKVWTIAGCLIGPVYVLSLVPSRFDHAVSEGVQTEFTSRAIAVLVKFVMVPLLLVFAAILHLAAIKVLLDGELPRGRIGWLVLSFGTATALTALAAFPTREAGGPLVRFFWRRWPWLLVVPLVLLAVALAQRVGAYGWTTDRYVAALAGLWLASLVVTQGIVGRLPDRLDLRLVSGSLALLLGLAAVGPWGATGFSIRSQAREFAARLEAAGALRDGRIAAGAGKTLSPADRIRLGAIVDHLAQQGRLRALGSHFEGVPENPFTSAIAEPGGRSDQALADRIRARLGLARSADAALRTFALHPSEPATFRNLPPAARLVGPFGMSTQAYAGQPPTEVRLDISGPPPLQVSLADGTLTVTDAASSRRADFDVAAVMRDPARTNPRSAIDVARRTGELPARLILGNAFARIAGDDIMSMNLTFWLVIGE